MKTNLTATLLVSATLGVVLAFVAAAGAVVLLPSEHSLAISALDLVSVTAPDQAAVVDLASSPATTPTQPTIDTIPSDDVRGAITAFVASPPAAEATALAPIAAPASAPVAEVALPVEQPAAGPINPIAVGKAVFAQVTQNGLPDVGPLVAAALPLLLGQ